MNNRILSRLASFAPQAWLVLLLGLSLYRLFLTGDRDIIALDSPHDEFWYVHKAFAGMWAGQYNEMSFVHPPIYVWWLQFLNAFGVSSRLGIEVAWVAAVAYLSMSVRSFTGSRVAALLLAAFLLLHPSTIFIFDRLLSETLLAVTVTACAAAGLDAWSRRGSALTARRLPAVLLFALMFAASFHVRKEGIAFLVPFCALAALTLFYRRTWWTPAAGSFPSPGMALVVPPLVATLLLGSAIASLNYFKWGSFARYDLASSGYEHAIAALSRIDTGRTPLQVSVTREMLSKGYSASPTLRELQPQMDGAVGQMWAEISRPHVQVKGEIGNGWFYWALRDAAAHSGWHSNARVANQKYEAVSSELGAAFANATLRKKSSLLPSFIDPDFQKWLPLLPQSFKSVMRVSFFPLPPDLEAPKDNASPREFKEYTLVAGRRSLPGAVELSGWVVAPRGSQVGFALNGAEPGWMPVSSDARPDVPGALAMSVTSQGRLSRPDRVVFKTPDGRLGYVLLSDLQQGKTATTSGAFVSALGVDSLDDSVIERVADAKLGRLLRFTQFFGMAFGACILLGLFLAAYRRKLEGRLILMIACLVFCASRIGMFALLDASSWNGAQARYMLPVLPLFGLAGAAGLALVLAEVRGVFLRRASLGPVQDVT